MGAEVSIALALVIGAVAMEDADVTALAVLAARPIARPTLALKVVVATASAARTARGFLAVALVGAALAVVTAPVRTALGVANRLPGALAVRIAGLAILALTTDAGVATAVRATFPAIAVRCTAQLGIIALIGWRPTAAVA